MFTTPEFNIILGMLLGMLFGFAFAIALEEIRLKRIFKQLKAEKP